MYSHGYTKIDGNNKGQVRFHSLASWVCWTMLTVLWEQTFGKVRHKGPFLYVLYLTLSQLAILVCEVTRINTVAHHCLNVHYVKMDFNVKIEDCHMCLFYYFRVTGLHSRKWLHVLPLGAGHARTREHLHKYIRQFQDDIMHKRQKPSFAWVVHTKDVLEFA